MLNFYNLCTFDYEILHYITDQNMAAYKKKKTECLYFGGLKSKGKCHLYITILYKRFLHFVTIAFYNFHLFW